MGDSHGPAAWAKRLARNKKQRKKRRSMDPVKQVNCRFPVVLAEDMHQAAAAWSFLMGYDKPNLTHFIEAAVVEKIRRVALEFPQTQLRLLYPPCTNPDYQEGDRA